MILPADELKDYLDFKVEQYNSPIFISSDPIQLPHHFSQKEDIEIVAFLVSTIAWGNRVAIIKSGEKLLKLMGDSPYDFVMNYDEQNLNDFVHRTFNKTDLNFFLLSLKNIYRNYNGLEHVFRADNEGSVKERIISFRNVFLLQNHEIRSEKHLSNPGKNSAAKRINMFLRWMVRNDGKGVDFGIWNSLAPSQLYLPLDVHTGNIARSLGILNRKQNDWHALEEIMTTLHKFDPVDPVKYDFALFGIGAFEKHLNA